MAYMRYEGYIALADPEDGKPRLVISPKVPERGQTRPLFVQFRLDEEERKSISIYELDKFMRPDTLFWEGYFDESQYKMVLRDANGVPRKLEGIERYRVQLEAWRIRYNDPEEGRPDSIDPTVFLNNLISNWKSKSCSIIFFGEEWIENMS